LTQRRTRAQVETETAQKQLAEAQVEAKGEFGTSDIPQLRELYKNRESENATKLASFTQGLDTLEGQLKDVERQVA
jgi:hypothetical protein